MKLETIGLLSAAMIVATAFAARVELPENAGYNAKLAADCLRAELPAAAPGTIRLVSDPQLAEEEWRLTGDGATVTIAAGKYGFTLGALHYLENICGYYVFSPSEKGTADDAAAKLRFPTVSGRPAFELRDIFFLSDFDAGRTAFRRGLNSEGEHRIKAENGGRNFYGSPKFCHTFHLYVPKAKYFADHPEWFSEINGKRDPGKGRKKTQLCLSNPELRRFYIAKMRNFILADRERAAKLDLPPPTVYDASMNDNWDYCTCKECSALAQKYGGFQSGVTLDFVNAVAEAIGREFPEVVITAWAYYYNEDAPRNIRARDNVVIMLCDTVSNAVMPLDAPENAHFVKKLADWSQLAQGIRIWDYNINFRFPAELPYNSEDTYQSDLRMFRRYKVKHLFTEMESPALSDARDYKVFLKTALMLDPDQDVSALKRRFAEVYFGPAAELFLRYRKLLKQSQEKNRPSLNMNPTLSQYTHLDLPTVAAAQRIFAAGEKLLAGRPDRLRRWRFARLALDRATLLLRQKLMREYFARHGSLKGYPFDPAKIRARIEATLDVEIPRRLGKRTAQKFRAEMAGELKRCSVPIPEKAFVLPEKFRTLPREKVFDFPTGMARIYGDAPGYVADPEATAGFALEFPCEKELHRFPMLMGVYSRDRLKTFHRRQWERSRFRPGYHWYHVGKSRLDRNCYFFFFRSWEFQQDLFEAFDPTRPETEFDIYLRLKIVENDRTAQPDAVRFDRLVLIKRD